MQFQLNIFKQISKIVLRIIRIMAIFSLYTIQKKKGENQLFDILQFKLDSPNLINIFQSRFQIYLTTHPQKIYSHQASKVILLNPLKHDLYVICFNYNTQILKNLKVVYKSQSKVVNSKYKGLLGIKDSLILLVQQYKQQNMYISFSFNRFESIKKNGQINFQLDFPIIDYQNTFVIQSFNQLVYYTLLLQKQKVKELFDNSYQKSIKHTKIKLTQNQTYIIVTTTQPCLFSYNIYFQNQLNFLIQQLLITQVPGNYSIVYDSDITQDQNINILITDYQNKERILTNPKICHYGGQCNINIEKVPSKYQIGYQQLQDQTSQDNKYMIVGKERSKLKIGQEMYLFLQYKNKDKKPKKLSINSDDVVMYLSISKRCHNPTYQCHDISGTKTKPIQITNRFSKAKQLYIGFYSIRSTVFQYTILDQQLNNTLLKIDQQRFATFQDNIIHNYKIQIPSGIQQIQCLLTSLPNKLIMYLNKGQQIPDSDNFDFVDSQGKITVKTNSKASNYSLSIQKRPSTKPQYLNYSILIVSDQSIKYLSVGQSIFGNIQPNKTKQYILIVNPQYEQVYINFEIYLSQSNHLKIQLIKGQYIKQLKFSQSIKSIDISKIIKKQCSQNIQQKFNQQSDFQEAQDNQYFCHVTIRIQNQQKVNINYMLLIFQQNSIIQLHDARVATFQRIFIDNRIHFYFPIHNSKPILLTLYSSLGDISTNTSLYAPKISMAKKKWAWPSLPAVNSQFKTTTSIKYTKQSLQSTCDNFKQCYLLISINLKDQQQESDQIQIKDTSLFGIVQLTIVTDTIILQNNQNVLIDISENQTKLATFDLNQVLSKQYSVQVGLECITGGFLAYVILSSDQNPNYPSVDQKSILLFQSHLFDKQQIKSLMQTCNVSSVDSNIKLMIGIQAMGQSQISLKVAMTNTDVGWLQQSVPRTIKVQINKTKIMGLRNDRKSQFKVKVQRKSGFPVVQVIKCKSQLYQIKQQCFQKADKIKDDKQQILKKDHQILLDQKNQEFNNQNLIYLVIIYSPQQSSQLTLYFSYIDSLIIVPQGNTFTDFLQEQSSSKFLLGVHPGHKLHLSLTVIQGQPQLIAPKAFQKSTKKVTLKAKQGIISYDLMAQKQQQGFGVNTTIEITIKCKQQCSYNFYYSSTDQGIILRQGQLASVILSQKKKYINFEYFPDRKGTSYIHLFYDNQDSLKDLQLIIKNYKVTQQQNQKQQLTLVYNKTFDMKDRANSNSISSNLQPSINIILDATVLSQISLKLINNIQNKHTFKLLASGIDIISLPPSLLYASVISYQLPQYYQTDILNEQTYVTVQLNLCSQNSVSYAVQQNYNNFINNKFYYQAQVSNAFNLKKTFKLDQGIFYQKITTYSKQPTFYTLKLSISNQSNIKDYRIVPGNRGKIQYKIIDDESVQLYFYPAYCQNCKQKQLKFTYVLVAGHDIDLVMSQTHCQGTFFDWESSNFRVIELQTQDRDENLLRGIVKVNSGQQIISIKGISQDGEQVAYGYIDMGSSWKIVHQQLYLIKLLIIIIVIIVLYKIINRTKGYVRIRDQDQQYQNL